MNIKKRKKADSKKTPTLHLTVEVLAAIFENIATRVAESGGVIGRDKEGTIITHFKFDESSKNSPSTYTPDHEVLNSLFETEWNPQGVRFNGFVHSHPGRHNRPSRGDEVYAERILQAIDDLEFLWLPIINTIPDTTEFTFTPWAIFPDKNGVRVVRGNVRLSGSREQLVELANSHGVKLNVEEGQDALEELQMEEIKFSKQQPADDESAPIQPENTEHEVRPEGNTFDRVTSAYDLNMMASSRIIAVGAGGAAAWLEELARAGLEQFVLIDPDTVSETNLATQQVYRRDIGRPKVDCIEERIRDINPRAKVVSIPCRLEDIDEEILRHYAVKNLDGRETRRTILCGLTDNFFAQAHVNRLALNFGLPSLCAQVYREGRGAEVTFTFPGITPACHRCILSSRYKHYLDNGMENDVTSHGTPIFATTRLNAIKGFILLAMLHHGSSHPRWGNMLERIGNRNLVLIRMDPDIKESLGVAQFDKAFGGGDATRLFFDEVVWLPEKHESPETGYEVVCPDCGGTGDLRNAIGKVDTTPLHAPHK